MASPLCAVIFDFDGVILDSNALKTEAFREIFARYPAHAEAMMAFHESHVSHSRYVKFAHLVEDLLGRRGDRALVNHLADEFSDLLRERMDACPFVPGAREWLDELQPRLPLYLASVTPEPELLRLLGVRGLRPYFTRVYGCPPWTKPDAVGAIVREHGGPEGIVLIGDSAGDQRSAAAHGVEFVARDSGLPFDPPIDSTPDISTIAARLRSRLPS